MTVEIVQMQPKHFEAVIDLQRLAFPPPFDEELLWKKEHLDAHLQKFADGQFVALLDDRVVGSCSNTLVSRARYDQHLSWDETVGGYFLETFESGGQVMYGLDISVHPDYRKMGIGRRFYEHRFALAQKLNVLYATACRIPFFSQSGVSSPRQFCEEVVSGTRTDRTLTPLLRYGLKFTDVLEDYMDDPESGNAAALLEWRP